MPRQPVQSVENSFVKGLITEATGLTFPENACTETYNCRFEKTGEVKRRKGINFEVGYSTNSLTGDKVRSASAVREYLWFGAGGDGGVTFVVTQIGQYLYFYRTGEVLSDGLHSTTVDLSTYLVTGAVNPYEHVCDFAQGNGALFVVGKHLEPFYISYDVNTDSITSTQIDIQVRDLLGDTSDPYDVNERPTLAAVDTNKPHYYNLFNQGWAENVIDNDNNTVNPVTEWFSRRSGEVPSNADRWWIFKDTDNKFNTNNVGRYTFSSSQVPRGHYKLNAFDMDRSTASGISSVTTTSSGVYRPSSVAFFARRVFYTGVDTLGYNSKLYYSQILTDNSKAGNCYQENDPTDEEFYDLLPNDGGVIDIPDIANIVKLEVSSDNLIIFATNGIWTVTGSEGIGFTATDYSIQKVSDMQNRNKLSFVSINGVPMWINAQGVQVFQSDKITGEAITTVSSNTIQSFFNEIPKKAIPYIKGVYNQTDKCIYWLYKSTNVSPIDRNYEYDRALVLNTETGAFYPWTLGVSSARNIIGISLNTGSNTTTSIDNVVDSTSNTVVDSSTNQVVTSTVAAVTIAPTTKFLVEYLDSGVRKITWAEEFCPTYEDFNACTAGNGINYESYFISGYRLRGEGNKKQRTSYVVLHSRQESNSSVYLQGLWDYRNSDSTNRWSNPQQGYLNRSNVDYVTKKLKIRGNGLSLQIKCYSEVNKPFNITGWSILDTVGTVP